MLATIKLGIADWLQTVPRLPGYMSRRGGCSLVRLTTSDHIVSTWGLHPKLHSQLVVMEIWHWDMNWVVLAQVERLGKASQLTWFQRWGAAEVYQGAAKSGQRVDSEAKGVLYVSTPSDVQHHALAWSDAMQVCPVNATNSTKTSSRLAHNCTAHNHTALLALEHSWSLAQQHRQHFDSLCCVPNVSENKVVVLYHCFPLPWTFKKACNRCMQSWPTCHAA